MRFFRHRLALLYACTPLFAASGQAPDVVGVITAATIFARASIIGTPGPIVIDEMSWRRSPGISEAVARRVARATGARRDETGDVIRCEEPRPKTHQRCTSADGAVVLTFALPDIRGSFATVGLAYTYVGYLGRAMGSEWSLELRRARNGRWRVTASKETGVT